MVAQDAVDPDVRAAAVKITAGCKDRDDLCELTAIFEAVRHGTPHIPGLHRGLKYMADNFHVDQFWAPARLLKEIKRGNAAADCLPLATKVVIAVDGLPSARRDVAIGAVSPGDLILSIGETWTRVTNYWDKGPLPTLDFTLDNGTTLRCSGGHRLICADASELLAGEVTVGVRLMTGTAPYHGAMVTAVTPGPTVACCDIETEAHRFYLPETDLVVHNCDDHAMFTATLAASIGYRVGLRAWGQHGSRDFQHVYAFALVPKEAPEAETYEFGLDTSADVGDPHAGWQPPKGHALTGLIEESDYR